MPELPEVETIRKQLDTELSGKKILKVSVLREKSFSGEPTKLIGKVVDQVGRKSKVIEVNFKNWNSLVIIHLKMTGQLVYLSKSMRIAGGHPTADWVNELPSSHTRVIWDFADGSKLFFNDMRVFGWMKVINSEQYEKEIRKQVPDVIDKEFDFSYLKSVLGKSRRAVKLVLTDQEKMGGMGNIYANDALYLSKINPTRGANSLDDTEIKQLHKAMVEVIKKGIKYGGSSASDEKFVDTKGQMGRYQEHFLVYERAGYPCKRDGELIKRMKLGGRSTYYCPKCQE